MPMGEKEMRDVEQKLNSSPSEMLNVADEFGLSFEDMMRVTDEFTTTYSGNDAENSSGIPLAADIPYGEIENVTDNDIIKNGDTDSAYDNFEFGSLEAASEIAEDISRSIDAEAYIKTLNVGKNDRDEESNVIQFDHAGEESNKWAGGEPEEPLTDVLTDYTVDYKRELIPIVFAALVALFSAIISIGYIKNGRAGFGLGDSLYTIIGTLSILSLLSFTTGISAIMKGLRELLRAEPGAESILALSGLFSIVDSILILSGKTAVASLPYCLLFSTAVCFYMTGNLLYRCAMEKTLTTAVEATLPVGVVNDVETIPDRTVLKKIRRKTEGFYRNIIQEDYTESFYRLMSPIVILAATALAAVSGIINKNAGTFVHALSAQLSIAASLTVPLAYSLPYFAISKQNAKAGAALAAWGGAAHISNCDSAVLCDEDIYPQGTVGIENVSIYMEDEKRALIYASSLIIASGSGLSHCFADLLKQYKLKLGYVYDFEAFESGGLKGTVLGKQVFVGNSGFMNLLGVRIPPDKDKMSSIYLAIDKEVCAKFDIVYVPSTAVQKSLISLVKTGISILFSVRDFNVTPAVVKNRFKVPSETMVHLSVAESYAFTENTASIDCDCMAILDKDSAAPFAAAIYSGIRLKNICVISTIAGFIGSILGMLLVFALFWINSSYAASPASLLLYMLANALIPLLLIIFTSKH